MDYILKRYEAILAQVEQDISDWHTDGQPCPFEDGCFLCSPLADKREMVLNLLGRAQSFWVGWRKFKPCLYFFGKEKPSRELYK